MTARRRNWLDPFFVLEDGNGVELSPRRALQIKGTAAFLIGITDDEANDRTILTIDDAALPTAILTTDATPAYYTILAAIGIGGAARVASLVKIKNAAGTVRQAFALSALFYGDGGGSCALDGDVSGTTGIGTGTATATLEAYGSGVRLKIVGIAATNLTTTHKEDVF